MRHDEQREKELEQKKYKIIYADPPWDFNDKKTGGNFTSAATQQYRTTTTYDLCSMPVRYMTEDDCILIMWYVNSMPDDALELARAWGFKKLLSMNGLVWGKITKKGKRHFGMGHGTRNCLESALIMYNGSLGRLIKDRSIRNYFEAPTPINEKGEYIHSAKPVEARVIIEKLCHDGNKLEMFARQTTEGWDVFGNQVSNSITLG